MMVRVGSQVKVHLAILILCLPYRVLKGTLALTDVVQSYTFEFLLVIHLNTMPVMPPTQSQHQHAYRHGS